MKKYVVLCFLALSGCASMQMPPPCNGLDVGHPCGEKRSINTLSFESW